MDNEARKAESRQWEHNSHKIHEGHLKICDGVAPEPLKMGELRGKKGALIVNIHHLQQTLIEDALPRAEKGLTDLKKELQARKLSDDLKGEYYDKYETGLRKLRDDLRLAALADADEQTVDTLGGIFRYLSQTLVKASPEVRKRTVESLSDKFGVSLAGHINVDEMFDRPKKKKPRPDPPGTNDGSKNTADEGPKDATVLNADDEKVDDMKEEGADSRYAVFSKQSSDGPVAEDDIPDSANGGSNNSSDQATTASNCVVGIPTIPDYNNDYYYDNDNDNDGDGDNEQLIGLAAHVLNHASLRLNWQMSNGTAGELRGNETWLRLGMQSSHAKWRSGSGTAVQTVREQETF